MSCCCNSNPFVPIDFLPDMEKGNKFRSKYLASFSKEYCSITEGSLNKLQDLSDANCSATSRKVTACFCSAVPVAIGGFTVCFTPIDILQKLGVCLLGAIPGTGANFCGWYSNNLEAKRGDYLQDIFSETRKYYKLVAMYLLRKHALALPLKGIKDKGKPNKLKKIKTISDKILYNQKIIKESLQHYFNKSETKTIMAPLKEAVEYICNNKKLHNETLYNHAWTFFKGRKLQYENQPTKKKLKYIPSKESNSSEAASS
jgi:hypothetical protein